MLSKKMLAALNEQINAELYSAYLYLAMAAYFEGRNFTGMAGWMKVQAKEEMGHAMRFYKYVYDRNGEVTLKAIAAPPAAWKSPLAAFDVAFAHEQTVTARIHKLVDLSLAEKDHATGSLLKWFVDEQVEEESNAYQIAEKLRMIGDSTNGLFMMDKQLAKRGEAGAD